MIEAIGRQHSGMIELQNSHQRLWVNRDFAEAFRGAAKNHPPAETPDVSPLATQQKAIAPSASPFSGIELPKAVEAAIPAATAASPAATTQSDSSPKADGWSGTPNQVGSSYNPVAGWDQVPGQQPSWITGNYPGATWTAVNEAGFLMPYSSLSPGPGEEVLSGANMNVANQSWAKYYEQMYGKEKGDAMVWGANNPNHDVPAPWLSSNSPNPSGTIDPSQPTQPNYVPVSQMPT